MSFPSAIILLALAGITSCFRFQIIHSDLTGDFGFLVSNFFCLVVAMIFGSNVSTPCWKPFRGAIEGLTVKFTNHPDLIVKHRKYIGMIKWEVPSGN